MRQLLFFGLIFTFQSVFGQDNIIKNNQFENGTNNWVLGKFNGASAVLSIDNAQQLSGTNSAKIEITNGGASTDDIQLLQNIELEATATYSIGFMAYSEVEKIIIMSIENDFEVLWQHQLIIDPDKNQYGPFNFFSENIDPGAAFAFNIGGNETQIFLDSVVFNKNIPTSTIEDEIAQYEIQLTPNPAHSDFQIELNGPNAGHRSLLISDKAGKEIIKTSFSEGITQMHFNIAELNMTPGIYFINANIDEHTASEKLIVY